MEYGIVKHDMLKKVDTCLQTLQAYTNRSITMKTFNKKVKNQS